jgi:predicted Rossmann fold flavoprotein
MSNVLETVWDVAVLGAGAAGLVAAIRAAELGAHVLLLEKNRRAGVKILMSGGTRCNITNARGLRNRSVVSGPIDPGYDPGKARGASSIVAAFGAGGPFLRPALKALSVEQSVALFESEGVATKIEANGKIFPVSDRAVDVLETLLRRLTRSGATLRTSSPACDLEPIATSVGPGFHIALDGSSLVARRVIVAVGGQSYPGSGTTGDGYAYARKFGHTVVEPRPALVPLGVVDSWVAELRGITVPDAVVRVVDADEQVVQERREAVLFAHFGLTGPAILDVSRAVARHDGPPLRLRLDLAPQLHEEALHSVIAMRARQGRPRVVQLLPEHLSRRLAEALVAQADVPADRLGPELTRDERQRLVAAIKRLDLPIRGTLGFAKAEVTNGGVALAEVDPETLESRLQPGLYFCGEVLDLDGQIGGYNFQAAWSTGWLAGQSAASLGPK